MDKGAAKLKPDKRIRLQVDNTNYDLQVLAHEVKGTMIVFFAVTHTDFTKGNSVQGLLNDLQTGFLDAIGSPEQIVNAKEKSLNKNCSAMMNRLFDKYGTDKLATAFAKVDQVKDVMKDNVGLALANVNALDTLDDKSKNLENQADLFKKEAKKVETMMRCNNWKMNALIALIVIIIIAIIIGSVA